MKITHLLLIITAPFLLTSCPYDDQLNKLNDTLTQTEKDLNAKIDDTRKTLADVSQQAIRAVPGERYLELIDDLFSGDPAKKQKAQDFLRNLGGIDVSVQYEATVWFDNLGANDQVEAAIFRAATPTFDEISVRLSSGSNINRYTVRGSATGGQYVAQAKQTLTNKIYGILNDAFGQNTPLLVLNPAYNQFIMGYAGPKGIANLSMWGKSNDSAWVTQVLQQNSQSTDKNRQAIAAELADAFFDPYSQVVPPNTGPLLHEQTWSLVDGRQFLFVIIREDDFNNLKTRQTPNKLVIRAAVHKKDDPSVIVTNSGQPIVFDLNEFEPRDGHPDFSFNLPNESQKYVWSVHNLTDFQGYDSDSAAKVKQLAEKLAGWEKLAN